MTYTPDALARMTDEVFEVALKYHHLLSEYFTFSTPPRVRVPVESGHGFRWKMITQSGGT
jgi:hypothetical protein